MLDAPEDRAPSAEAVNPTVNVETALGSEEPSANETAVGAVAVKAILVSDAAVGPSIIAGVAIAPS